MPTPVTVTDPRIPVIRLADAEALRAALAEPGAPPAAVLEESAPGPRIGVALSASGPQPLAARVAAAGDAAAQFTPVAARHAMGCVCCAGRSPAAQALDQLFQRRARGQCPWFDRVLALVRSPAGAAMLADALAEDVLTRARFRAAG